MPYSASPLSPSPNPLCQARPRSCARWYPARVALATAATSPSTSSFDLPLRKIPGDYGLPFIGPLCDRFAYFYSEGRDQFFRSRIQRYGSTVLRLNVPPGPFVARDPRVVALFDAASFPVLFDTTLVEKRDLFTGTFMPSTELTGGFRVLSYLDPAEPHHAPLKRLLFFLLSSRRHAVVPEFRRTYGALFDAMDAGIAKEGKADFGDANDRAALDFLSRCFFGVDPAESRVGLDGPPLINKWVVFQLAPLLKLGLPAYLEELILHSFRLPPALLRADNARLVDFFRESAGPLLDEAHRFGISREEALHNILFATCFNAFGGLKFLFPNLIKWLGRAGARLHGRLAEEISAGSPRFTVLAMESYRYQAKMLVRDYLLADPFIPYTSVLGGIFMCKLAYDFTQLISSFYFKGYSSLTKIQRIEWNNRGMSSAHAIYISLLSSYLVFFSDLFSDHIEGLVTFRCSNLSTFTLGVSVGYFITDLAMILWLYPSLGGMEYVLHHMLSIIAISYSMMSGEGQLYTCMVLISETTTPGINLRWFLDTAGMKRSSAYLINGVIIFFAWLVARIFLFNYLFYSIYLHYDQIKQMHTFGYLLSFVVPTTLFVMNMMWFWKILKGLKKTLAKRQ